MIPNQFICIDEEGYPLSGDTRIQGDELGRSILQNLHFAKNMAMATKIHDEVCFVEAFDEPLVFRHLKRSSEGSWLGIAPYELEIQFELTTLSVDQWDRFHGYSLQGIPFVFSRQAQNEFFNALDSFDDENIVIDGKSYSIPDYWSNSTSNKEIQRADYWTSIYHSEGNPGWNLGEAAPALIDMLPRLKIPRARILVAGCGEGHDAALFAREGHVVTAVDFSEEAIIRAKKNYGHIENLRFVQADIFQFSDSHSESFDYIFEHTLFCAINPQQRDSLIKSWNRMLSSDGHLIAILFAMEKKLGPPFGGSEWEYRKRLEKYFHFLFWGRWRKYPKGKEGRLAKELFIFAKKRNSAI